MNALTEGPHPVPATSRPALWHSGRCTVCGHDDLREFLHLPAVPAQDGLVWPTREEALAAPSGEIRLMLCRRCGYAGNRSYDAARVRFAGYDVSLEYSGQYRTFVRELAARLVETYGVRGKTVLEIACGKGFFLRTICRTGGNRGIGYDPAYADEGSDTEGLDITFVPEYYGGGGAPAPDADLICCRQLLDILDDQSGFLLGLRRSVDPARGTVLFFETPNADATLTRFTPWNVVYEHCSWFTAETLALFFELHGFDVLAAGPCNNDEYLCLEARPAGQVLLRHLPDPAAVAAREAELTGVAERFACAVRRWRGLLAREREAGRSIALWGAGARAIGFLSALGLRDASLPVADINPRRQGRFLAGTGQLVVAPVALRDIRPDLIVVTNPAYATEIRTQAGALGLHAEVVALDA